MRQTRFIGMWLAAAIIAATQWGCSTASFAPLAVSAAGTAGGYLAGGAIDDSEGAKLGGMAVGLIAASQAYEYLDTSDEKKIQEAYEQGRREARREVSNAYWREAIGADGAEYEQSRSEGAKTRQISRDPHINGGIVYGAEYGN